MSEFLFPVVKNAVSRKAYLLSRARIPAVNPDNSQKLLNISKERFITASNATIDAEDRFKAEFNIGLFGEYRPKNLLPAPVMISLAKSLAFFKSVNGDTSERMIHAIQEGNLVMPSWSDMIFGFGDEKTIKSIINAPRTHNDRRKLRDLYVRLAREKKHAYVLYGYTAVEQVSDHLKFYPRIRIVDLGEYRPKKKKQVTKKVKKNLGKIAGGIDSYEAVLLGLFGDSKKYRYKDILYRPMIQEEVEKLLNQEIEGGLGFDKDMEIESDSEYKTVDLSSINEHDEQFEVELFRLLMGVKFEEV